MYDCIIAMPWMDSYGARDSQNRNSTGLTLPAALLRDLGFRRQVMSLDKLMMAL